MSKYGNRATVVDGIRFASAREARRYGELKLLERAGEIRELSLQPGFQLSVNGQRVCAYIADFRYENKDGSVIVEDVKGVQTEAFKIKRKLMKACLGIDVILT